MQYDICICREQEYSRTIHSEVSKNATPSRRAHPDSRGLKDDGGMSSRTMDDCLGMSSRAMDDYLGELTGQSRNGHRDLDVPSVSHPLLDDDTILHEFRSRG